MKTKAILLVIAALIMSACELPKENKVERVFREYVRTDFNNPSDFIKITRIEKQDTLDMKSIRKNIIILDSAEFVMSPAQKIELRLIKEKANEDSIFIVQHELKVRVKSEDGEQEVKSYFVIENKGEYTVQDHPLRKDEAPKIFGDILDLLNEVTLKMDAMSRILMENLQ